MSDEAVRVESMIRPRGVILNDYDAYQNRAHTPRRTDCVTA